MRSFVPKFLLLLFLSSFSIAQAPSRAALLARGKYIVEGPSHCFNCHGEPDWSKGGLVRPGTKGQGRVLAPEESLVPLPYRVVAPNLTPDRETGAGTWSDVQLARALREGIGHDGRTLFPIMPYVISTSCRTRISAPSSHTSAAFRPFVINCRRRACRRRFRRL
jgi:hypothetical protein